MCFKNLPIEFDSSGKAHLKQGWEEAFKTGAGHTAQPTMVPGADRQMEHDKVVSLLSRNGNVKEFNIDPVTRVAGALAFHSVADLQERKVLETRSMATLFRGYEIILKGRDPRDAIFISSRACGVCGGVHAVTSAYALDMAFGVTPPPLGTVTRNLLLAAEFLYDHPIHVFLLCGPDYCESAVRATNPEIWERAVRTPSKYGDVHGYKTIGDLMIDLNPLTGSLYLEGLEKTRLGREMYVFLGGKYPHPQTVVPGGMTTTVTRSALNEYFVRLGTFIDYGKKMARVADDLYDFFIDTNPEYLKVGLRPANLIDTGIMDDPDLYDATYENADAWGDGRWMTPGVVVDGQLVTTSLKAINVGMEEFVNHSFYEEWTDDGYARDRGGNGLSKSVRYTTDPSGNPISPFHMWNKDTIARPGPTSWKEKYSWDTAPRWDRLTMETGAYSRMWNTAVAQKIRPNDFLESTGHSLKFHLPAGELPAMTLEWNVPKHWCALERNRARAYAGAFNAVVAYNNLLKAWQLMKEGEDQVFTKYEIPKDERVGVGFWGAGRGYLVHWTTIDKGVIQNYQIVTPSTWNASPQDPWGNPGAYEEAVLNTPILENFEKPEDYKGIDVLRAIRSFDPCMPCTTHIYDSNNKLLVNREVNTCACELDE
ncbi:MAG TPA: nickel-dependent hydrogenase large subunit [Candidatus Sulfotelmatobacter sp.]|nr:nickel-dependent hydrogenase large subunit [Candidatus Sulfotelmatobacter sp.]